MSILHEGLYYSRDDSSLTKGVLGVHVETAVTYWIFQDGTFSVCGPADLDACILAVIGGRMVRMEKSPTRAQLRP